MNAQTQAVLFNAVPLLVVAALYAAVTATLAPAVRSEWRLARRVDLATALMYPLVGTAAGILGVETLVSEEPVAGNVWVSVVPIALAAVPPVLFFANWRNRALAVSGGRRALEAEQGLSARERELDSVARLSRALLAAETPAAAARAVLQEVGGLFALDLVALGVVDHERRVVSIVDALDGGRPLEWMIGLEVDLDGEPSGAAAAVAEGRALTVEDATSSELVSRRLVDATGVASVAFVPLATGGRVVAVLTAASRAPRSFPPEELDVLQALGAEGALALERLHSAGALAEALERERLIARIGSQVRSELDPDAVLSTAVREVGEALGLSRCLIRIGDVRIAEWSAPGREPVGPRARLLPASNLVMTEHRTIVCGDAATEPAFDEAGRALLVELGSGSVLAVPLSMRGETLGALALHRAEAGRWSAGHVALAEAVAHEAAVAVRAADLLAENRRRLEEQRSLLEVSRALVSELHFDGVISRIVEGLASLLDADAADCWLLEHDRRARCVAVRGLPESEIGRVIPLEGTVAEAVETGRPVLRRDFATSEQPPPSESYRVFAEVIDAPIAIGDEVRGVLGVCSREPGRFGDDEVRLIAAFARLVAIAVRNAEAFEEAARQTQVQRGFFRIASVLGEPLSAAATLDAVAQASTEALGANSAVVLRPVGGGLEVVGAHELPAPLHDVLAEGMRVEALVGGVRDGYVLAAPRLARDDRFEPAWRAAAARAGIGSLLAVPVAETRGQPGGLVLVFFEGERLFADADLELARQVAVAARGALERSELYELERRSRALAQQLAHTGRELATELDPAAVLDEVVRQAPALLGAEGASVQVLEGDELVLTAAEGPGAALVIGARTPSTTRLGGDVVQSRTPVALADVAEDTRVLDSDPLLGAGSYAAYLGVALVSPQGGASGVLAVYSMRPREWRPEEVEALQALGGNAAAALANAELYQRVALENERREAILANVADGIVAVDREGTVVLWNEAAGRITGVPVEEALGRTPEQLLGSALVADAGAARAPQLVSLRRGSEEVWISVSEAVMTDPAGAVAGRIFAFRDISDERLVEQMKSTFVSTVSHELRTPLTSIYGFAETLLRDDVHFGDEERRTFLRYISSESERLTAIVDTLLSVARLEAGDVEMPLAPTDVAPVVSEAIRAAEAAHGGEPHTFAAELPEEPLAAEADSDSLRQVLAILLDNAVRYSPGGGDVLVSARRANGMVEVSVSDEGMGVPPGEREHVFRKFWRGGAAGGMIGTGNTGLGLFIAEGLVHAMGGRIWMAEKAGRGSTFVFELPAARTETPVERE